MTDDDLFTGVMRDVAHEAVDRLMNEFVHGTEDLIRQAITKALGTNDWSLDEMRGRLESITYPDKIEVVKLDGKPILELHPAESGSDGAKLSVSRKFRMLI